MWSYISLSLLRIVRAIPMRESNMWEALPSRPVLKVELVVAAATRLELCLRHDDDWLVPGQAQENNQVLMVVEGAQAPRATSCLHGVGRLRSLEGGRAAESGRGSTQLTRVFSDKIRFSLHDDRPKKSPACRVSYRNDHAFSAIPLPPLLPLSAHIANPGALTPRSRISHPARAHRRTKGYGADTGGAQELVPARG